MNDYDAGASRSRILTKILATVGPACIAVDTLTRLIEEGVRVFRINFSHGTIEQFKASLDAIREAEVRSGQPIGVLGDLSGPKIRVGKVRDGGVTLTPGDRVEFQAQPVVGGVGLAPNEDPSETRAALFSVTLPTLIDDVSPGDRLLLDDGNVRCLVVDKAMIDGQPRVVCRVTVGGLITSSKGINLPETKLSVPSITDRDWECARWAVSQGIDFLALSFVRRAADIIELRTGLTKGGAKPPPIIAKIEKPEALQELEAIIGEADGVMVARGDLGVEMDLARVPVIQKRIIRLAHDYGKPVIVATQMLQSMVDVPSPTRAEVSDVANAIFDGADAVMLSGETAVGKYPVQVVHVMARIAAQTEPALPEEGRPPAKLRESKYRTAALAHGVSVVVRDLDARLVVTWSEAGGGARYLSQNRLGVPIVAFGSNRASLRRMAFMYGVIGVEMNKPKDTEAFLVTIDQYLLDHKLAEAGDPVVVVKGDPIGTVGVTNEIRLHYVGDLCRIENRASMGD